jgi:hypothetical protein
MKSRGAGGGLGGPKRFFIFAPDFIFGIPDE